MSGQSKTYKKNLPCINCILLPICLSKIWSEVIVSFNYSLFVFVVNNCCILLDNYLKSDTQLEYNKKMDFLKDYMLSWGTKKKDVNI
jgi:hypothetical protein